MMAVLIGLGVGSLVFAPPLIYLLAMTERGAFTGEEDGEPSR